MSEEIWQGIGEKKEEVCPQREARGHNIDERKKIGFRGAAVWGTGRRFGPARRCHLVKTDALAPPFSEAGGRGAADGRDPYRGPERRRQRGVK